LGGDVKLVKPDINVGKSQLWKIDGDYIVSQWNGYVLDIENCSRKEFSNVHMWVKHFIIKSNNQKWLIEKIDEN
jgi:hypothetical protein